MQVKINLTPSMVRDFVQITSQCDFDIDIAGSNHFFVDAKSIVGVYGLDMSRPVTVSYEGFNEQLENFLKANSMAS